ncbi:MAG: hypothetical protein RQ714_04725 [Nitrosomonas sp.]|nr:hypothetical protein [Nitrosomonas sp.]
MSRLWRDQLQVFLAPDQVIAVGQSRGFKPVQLFRQHAACTLTTDPSAKPLPWELPVNQLEQLLEQLATEIKPGTELQVTLADDFVRYSIVAPQAALANPDELLAYAGFQLREIYGERVDEWVLGISNWDPLNGGLCAAIPLELLAALEHFAVRHKLKLKQTEPYLAAVLDYWSKKLPCDQLWFVLIETNRFCLVLMRDERWQCIRNQRVISNLEQELLSALEQEAVLSGQSVNASQIQAVKVFAPAVAEWQLSRIQGWHFERLSLREDQPVPACFPRVDLSDNHMGVYA